MPDLLSNVWKVLRTPLPHRLKGKARSNDRHNNVQRGADVDRDGRVGVGEGGHDGRHDAHDAIESLRGGKLARLFPKYRCGE